MKIQLSIDLINKILAYLGQKPYQEVFQLIQSIQQEGEESVKGKESAGGIGGNQIGGS